VLLLAHACGSLQVHQAHTRVERQPLGLTSHALWCLQWPPEMDLANARKSCIVHGGRV
jgi:hypothetical protein